MRLPVRVRIGRMRRAVGRRRGNRGVPRRFPRGTAVAAEEGHRHQAEHVERRHERGDHRDHPHGFVRKERTEEDLVFAEKTRQRKNARNCQRADHHRREGDGHVLLQVAHAAHVLLAAHRVYDRAAPEEQQRLEERVRHQMECAG